MKHQNFKISQECNFLITKNSPILDWNTIFKAIFFQKMIFSQSLCQNWNQFCPRNQKIMFLFKFENVKISSFSEYTMAKMSYKVQFLGYINTMNLFRNLHVWKLWRTNWFFKYEFGFWDNRVVGFKPPTL